MSFVTFFNQATAFANTGQYAEAIPLYRRALEINRGYPQLYNDLGVAFYHTGNVAEAREAYRTAIYLAPLNALAYSNLGVLYNAEGRHGEALAFFNQAVRLDPKCTSAYVNLGDSYIKLSMYDEAEAALERALRLNPASIDALSNMGVVQWGHGRLMAALDAFKEVLRRDPQHAIAHKNIGLIQLMRGYYADGWKEYAWRNKADKIKLTFDAVPLWEPEKEPATLLGISNEQGLGDQILHASILDDILTPLILEIDPRLRPLYERSFPGRHFHSDPATTPTVSHQMPLPDLGSIFRMSAADFPGTPYLLADQAKVVALRARLAANKFKIGMSWGSAGTEFASNKFIVLPAWQPLFDVPDTQFINLQYGAAPGDIAGFPITSLPDIDPYRDLDGLAALIMACDLIITTSNTTAHLAGALGKPTWVMVPNGYSKFWYWGERGETTPWYKSVRLFRRGRAESWEETMARVALALKQGLAQRPNSFRAAAPAPK